MKQLIMILVLLASLNVFAKDMSSYLMDAEKLAQEGKNKEALEQFIWIFDNSLEQDPAFSAARTSYLLFYWKNLANKYPPALKALHDVRDKETKLMKDGKGTYAIFRDVVAINGVLTEDEKSIELFMFIDKKYPELAESCWTFISRKIIASGKFDLVKKYVPDPMKEFDRIVRMYKTNVLLYKRVEHVDALKKSNESIFVGDVLALITVLEAIKDKKTADQIRKQAFEILHDPRLM